VSAPTVPAAGPHGGDGARLAHALGVHPDEILDLSASLNPFAPDVAPLVAAHADTVHHYPDAEPATAALAAGIEVDAARVVLTNGGAEAIALVAAEHPVGRVDPPDFSLYARHLASLDRTGLRWRSNPHNPSGRLAAPTERSDVWDEAFYPLATGHWTRRDPDTIVVGSLTKLFACPGLRLGYVLAPDVAFAEQLRRRQPRWSVGSLACAVLPDLLARSDLPRWAGALATSREALTSVLHAAGAEPQASDASYVLVPSAPGLRSHLARRHVLVRDTASFGIPDGVRIAVPNPAGLEQLGQALERWNP
jgi:histidinol-phosphate/aromatic aminotransferase/cobyric acid decarboxylase-like protein